MSFRYFISYICVSDRHNDYSHTSFEKVTEEEYNKFLALPSQKLYLGDVLGDCSEVTVVLNVHDEWKLREIVDDETIKAINILWELLPKHYDIVNAGGEECDEKN